MKDIKQIESCQSDESKRKISSALVTVVSSSCPHEKIVLLHGNSTHFLVLGHFSLELPMKLRLYTL